MRIILYCKLMELTAKFQGFSERVICSFEDFCTKFLVRDGDFRAIHDYRCKNLIPKGLNLEGFDV